MGMILALSGAEGAVRPVCSDLFVPPHSQGERIAKRLQFLGLAHKTSFENLILILKSWALQTGGTRGVGVLSNHSFEGQVFLSLIPGRLRGQSLLPFSILKLPPRKAGEDSVPQAVLVFDLSPLSRADYHVSEWQRWGKYNPKDKQTNALAQNESELQTVFSEISRTDEKLRNEVVFKNDLSLNSLLEIWVQPEQKKSLLRLLKHHGILKIRGVPVEQFLVATTVYRQPQPM